MRPKRLTRFHEVLGAIPLLAGVYTSSNGTLNRADLLVEEIMLLDRERVTGVYIENNGRTEGEIDVINETLARLAKVDHRIKVGLCLVPDYQGREFIDSFEIASRCGLPFITLDIIAGTHVIGERTVPSIDGDLYLEMRKRNPGVLVLGGVAPPYAQLQGCLRDQLKVVGTRADAVMVKADHGEKTIYTERIGEYRELTGKPAVVASGVHNGNIQTYLPFSDGFIVGSGIRDTRGRLNPGSIQCLVSQVEGERALRSVL